MTLLQISEVENAGERCCSVCLTSDKGALLLKSITLLTKGMALTTAKVLKHEGAKAPVLDKRPEDPSARAWVAEKADIGWVVRFTSVDETLFDLFLKAEDAAQNGKVIASELAIIKSNLAKADIAWMPPEADPAYEDKMSDVTTTTGLAGS